MLKPGILKQNKRNALLLALQNLSPSKLVWIILLADHHRHHHNHHHRHHFIPPANQGKAFVNARTMPLFLQLVSSVGALVKDQL